MVKLWDVYGYAYTCPSRIAMHALTLPVLIRVSVRWGKTERFWLAVRSRYSESIR